MFELNDLGTEPLFVVHFGMSLRENVPMEKIVESAEVGHPVANGQETTPRAVVP